MTIHLPEDLERFVHDVVSQGRYAREDDVIQDALTRLRASNPESVATSEPRAMPAGAGERLTEAELDQKLCDLDLMSQVPDTEADFDDPDDRPIEIRGEPLSETIIRERR
jgi:Arc/MetJ-type ribon-helix-helix transcriptional regulator